VAYNSLFTIYSGVAYYIPNASESSMKTKIIMRKLKTQLCNYL